MAKELTDGEDTELSLHSAGEMLRRAREQKDMSIEDVAKTTRIPRHHLLSIESSDFNALPGRTYAIGFAKSYARAVGLSDVSIGNSFGEEMEARGHSAYQPETSGFIPVNPTSIPPKYLAWTAAGIGALILVAYLIWRTLVLFPNANDPTNLDPETEQAPTNTEISANDAETRNGPALSSSGIVILTATQNVWLKIYDADGKRLFEKEMAVGEKYTVPADANGPQILTGRPDALTVTVDGQVVPPLGTAERTIKDVGISAAALVARVEESNSDGDGNTVP